MGKYKQLGELDPWIFTSQKDSMDGRSNSDADVAYLIYSGSLDCEIKVWQLGIQCVWYMPFSFFTID